MSLGFRLLAPFFLAAWLAAVAFMLSHADSAPSAQRINLCSEKR
jgi:hypothetical protein